MKRVLGRLYQTPTKMSKCCNRKLSDKFFSTNPLLSPTIEFRPGHTNGSFSLTKILYNLTSNRQSDFHFTLEVGTKRILEFQKQKNSRMFAQKVNSSSVFWFWLPLSACVHYSATRPTLKINFDISQNFLKNSPGMLDKNRVKGRKSDDLGVES